MLYDLSGGLALKLCNKLEIEASKFFIKLQTTVKIKEIIECNYVRPNTVEIRYNGLLFSCMHNNCIAQLFQLLPNIYIWALPDFIFLHGSCCCINNNIVLLLGYSRSGKSTALHSLLNDSSVKYVSDEIIALDPDKKYILPLSNKPMQLREDVVSNHEYLLVNDAWNMHKVTYICPNNKVKDHLSFNYYRVTYCFIKYDKNSCFKVNTISNFELLNCLVNSCFNISKISKISTKLVDIIENARAINVKYDGNIDKLLEVII